MSRPSATRESALAETLRERGLEVLAENVLAEASRIDAVAVDAQGRLVLAWRVAQDDDQAALTRALAARAWVSARSADWRKLAPMLPIAPDAAVTILLFGDSFSRDTQAAAAALGGQVVGLRRGAALQARSQAGAANSRPSPGSPRPLAAPAAPQAVVTTPLGRPRSTFRSGLSDEDLRLDPGSRRTSR